MNRDDLLRKAQKAFALAGPNPTTPEEKAAYQKGLEFLARVSEPGEVPRPLLAGKVVPRKNFWFSRTKTISWREFFQVEHNKPVVFRLIPHASVTNNNKRLWRAIHKMYEMYESMGSRLEREGFRLRYREKDLLWFDIVFRQVDGQKKVEFYISTSEFQAQKLKRKIENKLDVTVQEADIRLLEVPLENTVVQDLRYTRHDLFSLNTNTQEKATPIASILNTVDELQFDGDFARLSLCMEAESRQKWVKNASWAYEKLQKGKVPQRASVNGKKVLSGAKVFFAGLVNEINDLLTDTFQAFTNVFFKSEKQFAKEKVINKAFSLEDEIHARKLTGSSLEKLNYPVFKTRIRVAAHSEDRLTRDTISDTLGSFATEIAENNELQAFKVRIGSRRYEVIEEMNTLKLSVRTLADGNANLVSTEELAKLALQMPPAELQRKYDDVLNAKARAEVNVPSVFRGSAGMYVGVAEVKDQAIDVRIPMKNPDEFYRGYTFIGGQGAGKDTAIKNWVVDGCLNHGISFIIPEVIVEEGERGMADGIRDSLPADKVIDLDMADGEYVVPMDLTEVIAKLGRDGASRFGDEVIDFFGDMEALARSKRYLRAAAKAAGGSLYNIKRLIEEEEFRLDAIERLQNEGNVRLADELIGWGTNDDLGGKADAVLNRLDDFFGNDKLFDVFSQPPNPDVDFARWMREGKVVIIRIPARKLGQVAARTLVHWVALKTFMTRLLMSKAEQENGCFMVFNEPEQYATEGLTRLMGRIGTEGRKERLGSLYAFHHWNKLPTSLQENLQGGGVQQFLFMNDHLKTFELSRHRFEETIPLEEAVKLPAHYAIVSVRAGGAMQPAFVVHMAPPVSKRFPQYDNSFLTRRHARMYGRHWRDLQQAAV